MIDDLLETYEGKEILVTGGCGSIGSEIVRQLLKYNPKSVRVLDNCESKLFHFMNKMNEDFPEKRNILRYLLGDVRDKNRLKTAVKQVNIVFHAAALKHVALCEYNPYDAVQTNVIGTQNLIDVVKEEKVEKMILISTDKAVNPINTMGATKLLGEKLMLTAAIGRTDTLFSCVRFGNVINSDGSVIPIFKKQIKKDELVTVTSEKMTRFFMTISDAVYLVLKSTKIMEGREIFILKMPSIKIIDLAKVLIENLSNKNIKIEITNPVAGEKYSEMLVTPEESQYITETEDMYILKHFLNIPSHTQTQLNITKQWSYDSNTCKTLAKDEIRTLLKKSKII